jgi:RES domain-containing protein
VAVDAWLRAWSGYAYRHIPAGAGYDILDFRFAGLIGNNRWNVAGERTLYVAADSGVVIAEFAPHLEHNWPHVPGSQTLARELYRLHLSIDTLLDLRDRRVMDALFVENAPHCFLDQSIARATADYVRRATRAQALLVPSMAFLDDPARWVGVIFLENLQPTPGRSWRRSSRWAPSVSTPSLALR